ncbi:MAG TPA: response regulator transcription factor [Terriglobales bacterium]|jgi:DNA-binding NarL/FixJ family response regulator
MSAATSAATAIGVLIADSNQTQRQLLSTALRRRPDFRINCCGLDGEAALAAMSSFPAQVIVLNLGHSRDAWQDMAILRRLHLSYPQVHKVVLLDTYDRDLVVNAFRSGAKGLFCFADSPFRLLSKCIHSVQQGQLWANNTQLQYVVEALTQVPSLRTVNARGLKLLTPREEQVVALVADGLSNREIAAELNLSQHTVKKYLFRIFDKLGISSRVELVLYAVSHGGSREAEWMTGGKA